MTNDTARAILAFDKDELFHYSAPTVDQEQNGVSGFWPLTDVDVSDLKRMARLWRLRKEMPYCGIEDGCTCNFCDYIHGRTDTHFTLETEGE